MWILLHREQKKRILTSKKTKIMSKLTDSLLSGSSGRVGRVVVTNVSGTEILRHRPKRSSKPPTPKQLLIQSRFVRCSEFIESYKSFAKKHFGQRFGLKSPFNHAITNLLNSHKLDYDTMDMTTEYSEIEFSKGSLLEPFPTGLSSPDPMSLEITWADNSAGDAERGTDKAQILYVVENARKSNFASNVATRSEGTVTL